MPTHCKPLTSLTTRISACFGCLVAYDSLWRHRTTGRRRHTYISAVHTLRAHRSILRAFSKTALFFTATWRRLRMQLPWPRTFSVCLLPSGRFCLTFLLAAYCYTLRCCGRTRVRATTCHLPTTTKQGAGHACMTAPGHDTLRGRHRQVGSHLRRQTAQLRAGCRRRGRTRISPVAALNLALQHGATGTIAVLLAPVVSNSKLRP